MIVTIKIFFAFYANYFFSRFATRAAFSVFVEMIVLAKLHLKHI